LSSPGVAFQLVAEARTDAADFVPFVQDVIKDEHSKLHVSAAANFNPTFGNLTINASCQTRIVISAGNTLPLLKSRRSILVETLAG
jgi:hypothetical protein